MSLLWVIGQSTHGKGGRGDQEMMQQDSESLAWACLNRQGQKARTVLTEGENRSPERGSSWLSGKDNAMDTEKGGKREGKDGSRSPSNPGAHMKNVRF
jgi:hypothetical protein